MKNLYKAIKDDVLLNINKGNKNGYDIISSLDHKNEPIDRLKSENYRIHYIKSIEFNNNFLIHLMTTIRPIRLVFVYDEDVNKKTHIIKSKQLALFVQTGWNEKDDGINKEYHYFINNIEDFDIQLIEDFYNKLLNTLQYNNLSIILDDIKAYVEYINIKRQQNEA